MNTAQGIIVIGSGGHAKVCIESLRAMGRRVAYCVGVGDAPTCAGVPVLHGDDHLEALRRAGFDEAFVALGANPSRRRLAAVARELGFSFVSAVHPAAVISPSVRLGAGVAVMAGALINAEAEIGDLSIINTGATVDHDCRIASLVHIAPQCGLAGNVSVGDGSFLGVGCKVIPKIRIGQNVTLGAGAVVVSDIPDNTWAWGVPARIQRGSST